MTVNALNTLLTSLKVEANVFHNGQYCGTWAIDTSGAQRMTFHVVSYGQCYLLVDGSYMVLHKGDAVFFPSDARHRVSSVSRSDVPLNMAESMPFGDGIQEDGTGLVCGNFGHQNPMFDRLLGQLPKLIVVRAEQASASARVIGLLVDESVRSGEHTSLLLNRLSDCLLYILLRDHVDTDRGVFAAIAHPKLGLAMTLIHGPTDRKLSVDELATAAAMSRSAFAAEFKSTIGASPSDYITQWRMTQAYRWLADDSVTTYAAALRCGYESEAAFSKAFKRVLGIGPGEARRGADVSAP